MLWAWVLFGVSMTFAKDFCEDFENEVGDTLEVMKKILGVFYGSLFAVTADVALGLKIATVLLRKIPQNGWKNEIERINQECEDLLDGYMNREFGDHKSSQKLLSYMLNTTLWEKIIDNPSYGSAVPSTQHIRISINSDLSDKCFEDLFNRNCFINNDCFVKSTRNGFDFGKTHYLLFLQIASAIDCGDKDFLSSSKILICREMYQTIFSKMEKIYSSAEFDVLLEEIVLCSIEGYDGFNSREIQDYVKIHEKNGCFIISTQSNSRTKKTDILTMEKCHSHTNAVGLSVLASFLKSLIEKCEN